MIQQKPSYFRAKVGRRLQKLGAVASKSSVYVLPNDELLRSARGPMNGSTGG